MTIQYMIGDATYPVGQTPLIIAHVTNDAGKWGAGFTKSIDARWPHVRNEYLKWQKGAPQPTIGSCRLLRAERDIYIANLCAMHGVRSRRNKMPLDYYHLERALETLSWLAPICLCPIHMPRIGTGLAGGHWGTVEAMINRVLADCKVYVYDKESI